MSSGALHSRLSPSQPKLIPMKALSMIPSAASITTITWLFAGMLCLIITTASSSPKITDRTALPPRIMQQSTTPNADFLTLNSAAVLKSIEDHVFSKPVQRNMHKLFSSRVNYNGQEHSYPSLQYTFDGFWSSWKAGMKNKVLFGGDTIERNMTIQSYADTGKRLPDQAIIISGFEYGLANMAAFLSQVMVDGIYVDECSSLTSMSENKCMELSEEEKWAVPIDKWQSEVQEYSLRNWNYKEQLIEFVNGGMNRLEYHDSNIKIDYSFIHSVSGVFRVGCHDVDTEGIRGNCPSSTKGTVRGMSERRTAFSVALSILRIPRLREMEVVQTTLENFKEFKEGFVENLLLYRSGEEFYPSQRYNFDELVSAIELFSKPPENITVPYPNSRKKYFQSPDHEPFYMGEPYMKHGHKYGLGNIALFFANGLQLSIEKDDSCDEINEQMTDDKFPISNSCGQRGLSYQDMVCSDDTTMACAVDLDMELTAATFSREVGSPPPLTCAPRSQMPYTGYWDTELIREENSEAYANENGRVDVSGCCWWGRGVLQMKGVCAFGRLNYYVGSSARGRSRLYDIDFCANPEAICASPQSHELIWTSGLFSWIDRVQSYDQPGFNYMKELREFGDSGFRDEEFIMKTNNIVQWGCHNPPCLNTGCIGSATCSDASDASSGDIVTKAYRTILEVNLWDFPQSPGGSNMPSPSPTKCKIDCTDEPTNSPLNPTISPSGTPTKDPTAAPTDAPTSKYKENRMYFVYVKMILENKREQIEKEIFSTPDSPVYTFDGFLEALRYVFTEEPDGLKFFLGQDSYSNLGHGIVNVALFLAHASTRGLRLNTCQQQVDFDIKDRCPMTIADAECPVLVESTTRRGIFLNQSPCDIGRLNYIFGKPAHNDGRESARYNFNFCLRPQVICYDSTVLPSGDTQNTEEIKYLIGFIEWMDRIQTYSWGNWDYIERLHIFVDDGMRDLSFVDQFSDMVVNSPDDAHLRKATFRALLHILFDASNPPSPNVGSQAVIIPPNNYDTGNPTSPPVYQSGKSYPPFIVTQTPMEIISPAPPVSTPLQESSESKGDGIEASLSRVDLPKNTATVATCLMATFCALFALVPFLFS